ncbi:glycosyltransferase family 4 protein [[Pseudomonas] carboxydohydrogena]|uniref:Glycosyltransferase family 4 protein n=1 Tax=Afipia carboxydohydrogena TaxID=290 RepID=A0ABY8BM44_AFICR|nr:hypothetical protein [[Pseudomonas] carboxydohydrogena]WEF51052.1 glycosyltransferase family 4 protein [[Pseudomonas] carboxydohydrogena]
MNLEQEPTVSGFCQRVLSVAEAGDPASALQSIAAFVIQVISQERSIARVFSSAKLDRLCLDIGNLFAPVNVTTPRAGKCVFLATGVSKRGGHSRVISSLMQADPASERHVLITNIEHDITDADVPDFLQDASVSICREADFAQKVVWLRNQIRIIAPERIYVLIHHFDSVAIAALQPGMADQIIYIHNCDHSLSLGSHVPHYRHVDLHAKGYYYCRENCGVKNNQHWPMVTAPSSLPLRKEFLNADGLVTATSGGFEKFESPHLNRKIPYSISYAEAVPRIIAATGGRHIHIGGLSRGMLSDIHRGLEDGGIAKDRFINVSYVPRIPEALIERNVDLYLTSFPLGGGLVAIEVMSAGIPILAHSNYRSAFFSSADLVYPGAGVWRDLDELSASLKNYTPDDLKRQSVEAFEFYKENHLPELLKACVLGVIENRDSDPPRRPVYYADQLQAFLDEGEVIVDETEVGAEYAEAFTRLHWRIERTFGKCLCRLGLNKDGEFLKARSNERRRILRQRKATGQ